MGVDELERCGNERLSRQRAGCRKHEALGLGRRSASQHGRGNEDTLDGASYLVAHGEEFRHDDRQLLLRVAIQSCGGPARSRVEFCPLVLALDPGHGSPTSVRRLVGYHGARLLES